MAVNRTLASVLVVLTVVVVSVMLAGGFGEMLRPDAGSAADSAANRSATTTGATATGTPTTSVTSTQTPDTTETTAGAPTTSASEREVPSAPGVTTTTPSELPTSTTTAAPDTDAPPRTTTATTTATTPRATTTATTPRTATTTTTATTPRTATTTTTVTTPTPPAFVVSIDAVTECGTTCRDVVVTLANQGETTATNVAVTTTVSAGGEPVWAGSESVGTLAPGEAYTTRRRVALDYLEALQIVADDGWVTIRVVVDSDQRTQTFTREEQVL